MGRSTRDIDIFWQAVAVAMGASQVSLPAVHSIPWDLVKKHRLGPLLYRLGCDRGRDEFLAAALHATERACDLGEAVATFSALGIPVALLKGVSYVGWLYDHPGERPMSDIDVLVASGDFGRARTALLALGYEDVSDPVSRSPLHHASTLMRQGRSIDLHRSMIQPWRSRIDMDGVWGRTVVAAERGDGARRLGPVDEVLFHLIHMARHELHVPLMTYVDASRLIASMDDDGMARLCERASEYRLARAISVALDMVDALANRRVVTGRLLDFLLPSPREVLLGELAWRPLQIARKFALVQGPREAVGLAGVVLAEQVAVWRGKVP